MPFTLAKVPTNSLNFTFTFMAAFGCVGKFPALFFKIATKYRNHVSGCEELIFIKVVCDLEITVSYLFWNMVIGY